MRDIIAKSAPKSPYLKTSVSNDMVIQAFDTPFRKKCMAFGILIVILFPFMASNYLIHIANLIAIASISAMALNLLCGNAGLLSLGHAAFMALGAYSAAIMGAQFGMPFWVVVPLSAIVGGIWGLIAGLPSLRVKGMYLGISTLGIHYVIVYVLSEYQFYIGAGFGIAIADPKIGPFSLSTEREWYWVLCMMVLMCGIFITNVLRSKPGRAWIAIHNRDLVAEIMGINIGYYKVLAFVLSTSIASMAGCIYAFYTNVASLTEYSFGLTISYLAMIIVGGMGSVVGSIMGAFLITLVPFALMYIVDMLGITGVIKEYFFSVQSGIFGLIIIVFLLVEPLGLAEIWRRIRDYFMLWPFRYKPLTITKR